MRTKLELATDVLRELQIIDAEETPTASDTQVTYVGEKYDAKLAELATKGVVTWTNTDYATEEIPDAVFLILSKIMAPECAPGFGKAVDPAIKASIELAMLDELRRQVTGTAQAAGADKTKLQLSTEVLRRLGRIQANETPSNFDAQRVWSAYDSLYANLAFKEMAYWKNATSEATALIPQIVFEDIVRVLTQQLSPSFGVSVEPEMDINGNVVAPGVLGWRNLKRTLHRPASGLPVKSLYF